LDAKDVKFQTQLIVNWVLLDLSAALMFYLSFRIRNSAEGSKEHSVKDVDENETESKATAA
ncbi:hypothetical protein GGI02_004688, partial [Coemansia sp. RSA 2322]